MSYVNAILIALNQLAQLILARYISQGKNKVFTFGRQQQTLPPKVKTLFLPLDRINEDIYYTKSYYIFNSKRKALLAYDH